MGEFNKEKTCLKCKYLSELYARSPKSERDYWVMTELFLMLHGGDVCKGRVDAKPLTDTDVMSLAIGVAGAFEKGENIAERLKRWLIDRLGIVVWKL